MNADVEVILPSELCSARVHSQEINYSALEVTTCKAHSQKLQGVEEAVSKCQ